MKRWKKSVAAVLAISACAGPEGCRSQATLSRADRWRADFESLRIEFPRKQIDPWTRLPRAEWEKGIDELEALPLDQLGDPEIAWDVERLLARFHDGHIHILADGTSSKPLLLPVRFRWFPDGLYVTATEEERLRGAKLVSLGGVPAMQALARAATWASYENESGLRAVAYSTLANDAVLLDAGMAEEGKPVPVALKLTSGSQETLSLQPRRIAEIAWIKPFKLPAYRQERTPANWLASLPEKHAIYLRYAECHDEKGNGALALQMKTLLQQDGGLRSIVDFRGNEGGDSAAFAPILAVLRRESAKGKRQIIAVTDRNTFSSAFRNAMELRDIGSFVIGEAPSQRPIYTGNVKSFALPNSKLAIRYTTKWSRLGPADAVELTPDVILQPSVSEYLAGEDPVLDRALSMPLPPP